VLGAGVLARLAILLLLGALAVHELRYRLGFARQAEEAAHGHGHEHLVIAGPALATLCALGLAMVIVRTAAGAQTGRRVRLTLVWPAASMAMLSLYVSQELVEGLLSPAHPDGLAAVFGDGGSLAVPASAAVGAVVALAVRVSDLVGDAAARWLWALVPELPFTSGAASSLGHREPPAPGRAPLASRAAGRAPPHAV
jgi:hypothetical protein